MSGATKRRYQETANMTETIPRDGSMSFTSPLPILPKAPSPSKDPGVASDRDGAVKDLEVLPAVGAINIFEIAPTAAMKMLCDTIEALVLLTGDIPPTPPASQPGTPNLGLMQEEKENVARHIRERHHSRQNSASSSREVQRAKQELLASQLQNAMRELKPTSTSPNHSSEGETKRDSNANPITNSPPASPIYLIDPTTGANLNLQHTLIIRKFYSKTPPSIPLASYLLRIHNYCPMSTGVYLATSLFLHRLAVIERIIPVTARNAHRLLLAGLRVSMKKLEDQKYGHSRFAKVGGVTEIELGRLEVGFCFLTNFDLRATERMLTEHAQSMKDGYTVGLKEMGLNPIMPAMKDKRPFLRVKGLNS